MAPHPRARVGALLVLLVAALLAVAGCGSGSPRGGPAASGPHPEIGFRTQARLDEHYAKHGREFGSVTRAEYLRRAQALRDAPVGGPVLQEARADGVVTRYDRASRAFVAFDPDLTIRTFFRPNDGEGYFRRQARR